uniref:Uncharacterized protein n=1 Tax=Anguilla anguilla TaxID=7936 RepID=A0A0E9T6T2_ANGAN
MLHLQLPTYWPAAARHTVSIRTRHTTWHISKVVKIVNKLPGTSHTR